MPQTNLVKARRKAASIGVTIKPSTRKNKKLDVYKDGEKVASIGDLRYSDFNLHLKGEIDTRNGMSHIAIVKAHRVTMLTRSYGNIMPCTMGT